MLLCTLAIASSAWADATPSAASALEPKTVTAGRAIEPEELWIAAHSAYDAGAFSKAAQLYKDLLAAGADSGWVYFNLGNAYLRSGELGDAIASYLEAQKRLPREGDVSANLAYARKSVKDAIAPVLPSAALKTVFFWHYALSPSELLWLLLALNAALWGGLTARLFRNESEVLRWATAGLLVFSLGTAASLAVHWVTPRQIAVVNQHEVNIHSGTNRDTVVRFRLHEGTEMAVVDAQADWVRVKLSDGKQGWVASEDIRIVRL